MHRQVRLLSFVLIAAVTTIMLSAKNLKSFPDAALDIPAAETAGPQTAVFAGGCFWGVEAVFEHLKGVTNAVSGFSGGAAKTAHYETVSMGDTGHAESVKVTYDPSQITYGQLLKVFFSVAHDPTELNRQGPDTGTQYRSVIFYANDEQKKVAQAYIAQLDQAHIFKHPIVTQVVPLEGFYPAEAYHQHFVERNPMYPYVMYNDLPKLSELKKNYPTLCKR
jgi:peptide-methionine (S)-S-oxide reductase